MFTKVFLVIALEISSLRSYGFSDIMKAIATIPSRWYAVLANKKRICWLGHAFHYEIRLQPIFMHLHQVLINDVIKNIDTSQNLVVLDIGANIGQFGISLKHIAPNSSIYSFEPNKEVFSILNSNKDEFQDWYTYNYGIHKNSGSHTLYTFPGRSGQASLYRPNASRDMFRANPDLVVGIEAEFIDSSNIPAVTGVQHFNLVKIDVEGAERDVLEQVSILSCDFVLVEVSADRVGGIGVEEALAILRTAFKPAPKIIKVYSSSKTDLADVLIQR